MSEIRMRQICLVAHDLDRIQHQVESVFGVEVCYRDPGVGKYGLYNFLIPFGDQFLETVSPQPGEHDTHGGRYLNRRGGGGDVPTIALRDAEIRFVPMRDGRPEGLGGLDIHTTDRARALANAEAAGCRTGDDLVTICGMRLQLV